MDLVHFGTYRLARVFFYNDDVNVDGGGLNNWPNGTSTTYQI